MFGFGSSDSCRKLFFNFKISPQPSQYILSLLLFMIRNRNKFLDSSVISDRLCGLVVRVSGYRYRGPGFDSRRYQIFRVVVGLERGPLSFVRSLRSYLNKKVGAPGLENRD